MSHFPDRRRPDFPQRTRALTAPLFELALGTAWRVLHPDERAPFVETRRPPPLRRVYYDADDGWSAPLTVLPECPGGAGEPVVLAHALGLSCDAWRYGGSSIAAHLQSAGFRVYLFNHRGDRDAIAPERHSSFDVDDIIARDIPAALAAVCQDSGFSRPFWVGHGLGGQLGIGAVARGLAPDLAGLVTLNAAVRFVPPTTEMRRVLAVARWLPRGWVVPHHVAAIGSAWVGEGPVADRFSGHSTTPARVRGVLRYAAGDVPVAVLEQVRRWVSIGILCDRTGVVDYLESVRGCDLPLLCVSSEGDDSCRPAQTRPLARAWHSDAVTELILGQDYGHDDVLFGMTAPDDVFRPVCTWLDAHRRRAWGVLHEETTRASGT